MRARVHPARLKGGRLERTYGLRAVGKHGLEPSFNHKGRAVGVFLVGGVPAGASPKEPHRRSLDHEFMSRACTFRLPRLAENCVRSKGGAERTAFHLRTVLR